ncbi:MAG: sterol desaturase family protein [Halieaceae bacterium]|jgi:sterol desaturase/sphingolipid hydroxylase (fatty acid hydroxylase superfamily)|nr:sterol desaturase family protein [Gammaproteobacteria bacterium]MBT4521506.1 sterol desaturase family protein [Halieaceae bacterium]
MLIDYEAAFYVVMFGSVVVAFWCEALFPIDSSKLNLLHLGRNFSIWFVAFLSADYVAGYYLVDIQSIILQQPFGIFFWFPLPTDWWLVVIGVLIVDISDYFYHRLSHRSSFLWRFHLVHHTDTTLDVSTSLRTHPLEMVLSNFWKIGIALVLGVPIWILGFRELLTFPFLFLQHANIALPSKFEKLLSYLIVTPSVHKLHHSVIHREHDRNFGEGLIFWDKLLGSFKEPESVRPAQYGIEHYQGEKYQTIGGMLMTPFRLNGESYEESMGQP